MDDNETSLTALRAMAQLRTIDGKARVLAYKILDASKAAVDKVGTVRGNIATVKYGALAQKLLVLQAERAKTFKRWSASQ
jgi:hypothetical protein